ncbi:Uncharacterized protein PCOAH_00044860 [Plasmodium coatneyi]|uniref:CH-like domain-containing protein n=1 Tax=Plasmodium coatneyi TaxID=208452 RepID=A0A1B1E4I0_9APIC|nr:Uncharacterized protein PCOAH_00044860 [Plasmodium coatneyi]ANQ09923.1 Uncharacterized protein PCOAH_00044860 [Plasmodium coatneyi]
MLFAPLALHRICSLRPKGAHAYSNFARKNIRLYSFTRTFVRSFARCCSFIYFFFFPLHVVPREIIKWLQYLNLPYSFRNIKNASNGVIVAEIINIYLPQTINMNSLENGFGKEIKKKNWQIIKRTLTSLSIYFDETAVINSEKNAIINLFVQLYEHFNGKKIKNELYSSKEESSELSVPSFARSTITQKVRESNVHDIVDEEKKMMSTYEIIKREEYQNTMMRTRQKEEKENSNKIKHKGKKTGLNETSIFEGLEKSSSIITINDISNYMDYTDIKTLDSFIKDKNNLKSAAFMKSMKLTNEGECQPVHKKGYTDENVEDIIMEVLAESLSDYKIEKNDQKDNIKVPLRPANMKKGVYKFATFEPYDVESVNNLYEKFYALCTLKKQELIDKILDQLTLFNENFDLILSLRGYQFFHLWKLFHPVLSSAKCDSGVFASIMNYLKQLLGYLKINDTTTSEIICNIILKGLFVLDTRRNKNIQSFCELIILLINNDKHSLMNILRVIKDTMSLDFFYLFLLTLLSSPANSFIRQKDVKDIYLYYLFAGLHTSRENIMLYTLEMLNMLSLLDVYPEIVHLAGLLQNILEINNRNYDTYLFTISCNVLSRMKENQNEDPYNAELAQLVEICFEVLRRTKAKKLLYFFFLYSHKILSMDDSFFDLYLKRYNELSDEEQNVLLSNNIFEASFRQICSCKFVQKHFSNIFCENLNKLSEESNLSLLHLLLTKGKWKTGPFLRILKNYIMYNKNMEIAAYLNIYEKIYEYTIQNVFLETSPYFDLSKEILSFFWFSTNDELKAQSFEVKAEKGENGVYWKGKFAPDKHSQSRKGRIISLRHFENLFLANKHNLGPHTKEYLAQLEKDAYLKKFVH